MMKRTIFFTLFAFFLLFNLTNVLANHIHGAPYIASEETDNVPPKIIVANVVHPSSCGASDGEIEFFFENVFNGFHTIQHNFGFFEILVNNGSGRAVDLPAGDYLNMSITIDGETSMEFPSVTLLGEQPKIENTIPIHPSTCGGSDGSIQFQFVNVPPGIHEVFYNDGSFSIIVQVDDNGRGLASGLSAGNYENLVIIINECQSEERPDVILFNPQPTIAVFDSNPPSSCSAADGSIGLSFTNVPDGNYTVTHSNGSFPNVSINNGTAFITGVSAGTYNNMMVSFASGTCVTLGNASVSLDAAQPIIDVVGSISPTTCGGNDGKISFQFINVPQGQHILTYNNGAFSLSINVDANGNGAINGLTAGNYNNLTITIDGCTSTDNPSVILTNPQPTIAVSDSSPPSSCSAADGFINLSFTNVPNGNYTVTHSNGSFPNVSINNGTATITGISAGTYNNMMVSFASGTCVTIGNANVTLDAAQPTIDVVSSTNPSTCGGNDGSISFQFTNVPPGQQTVTYNNGAFSLSVNVDANGMGIANGLAAANYNNLSIQVGDCTSNENPNVTLTDPPGPTVSNNGSTDPSTCGGSDGTISLNFTNIPNGVYTIMYDGGSFPNVSVSNGSATIQGVSAGTYSNIRLTANGCESIGNVSVTLSDPPIPTINVSGQNDPSTCGGTDGSINLSFSNVPNGNYTITYDGGSFLNVNISNGNATINNLSAGAYNNMTITANNCTSQSNASATLNAPGAPNPSISSQDPSSCTQANGSFTLSNLNIVGTLYEVSYTYNGNTITSIEQATNGSITISGLAAGTYTNITVSTGSGECISAPLNVTLSLPGTPTATFTSNDSDNTLCNGESITFTAGGAGGGTYNFFVNNQSVQNSNNNVFTPSSVNNGDQFKVVVTAPNDCVDESETIVVTVIQTTAPTGNTSQSFCQNDNPTIADLIVIGTNIQWYNSPTGGSPLPPSTPLVGGTTYFASQTQNGCESDERLAVTVIITQGGNAGTGGTASTCNDGSIINLNSIITGEDTGGTWTDTDGSGVSLGNPNQVSFLGINPGSYTFTYTVTGCNSMDDSSTAEIDVIETLASIDATALNPIVCSEEPIDLVGMIQSQSGSGTITGMWSGGQGFFTDPNAEMTVYQPTPNEFGSVTLMWSAIDPCTNQTMTAPVSVQINAGVFFVTTGPDQSVEGTIPTAPLGGEVTLSNGQTGTGTWSGGSGTFSNSSDPNATYTPANSEIGTTVTLTWTADDPDGNGPCVGGQSSIVQVTVVENALEIVEVTASPASQVICSNEEASIMGSATLSDGSISTIGQWSGGNGIFNPSATASTATYAPAINEAGTTVVLVWEAIDPSTNEPVASNPIQILVNPAIANISAEVLSVGGVVCSNQSVDLSASVILENGETGTGTWSGGTGTFDNANSGNTTYQLGTNEVEGNIVLIWTADDPDGSGPCMGDFVEVIITINPGIDMIEASGDEVICSTGEGVFSGTVNLANGLSGSGIWSGGLGSFTFNGPTAIYHPVASEAGETINLTFTADDPDGSGPCTVEDSQINLPLTINNGLENVHAGTDQTVCENQAIDLMATATLTSGSSFLNGIWSGGTGTFNPVDQNQTVYQTGAGDTGTFSLIWTAEDPDGNGPCMALSDMLDITISPALEAPIAINTEDDEICADEPFPTLETMVNNTETVNWYDTPIGGNPLSGGMNTLTFIPPAEGIYYAETINNISGCVSVERTVFEFVVYDLPSAAYNRAGFPFTNTTNIFTDVSTSEDGIIESWLWSFGEDADPATSMEQGPIDVQWSSTGSKTVVLKVTDNNNCMNQTTSSLLISNTDCAINISTTIGGPNISGCVGDQINFVVTSQQVSSTALEWETSSVNWQVISGNPDNVTILPQTTNLNGLTFANMVFDAAGDYSIQMSAQDIQPLGSNEPPCEASSDIVNITISELPNGMITAIDNTVCEGEQGEIRFDLEGSQNGGTYNIIYTGGAQNNYSSGSVISVPIVIGNNSFILTSITDNATGCTNDGINSSDTITVNENPEINTLAECLTSEHYILDITIMDGLAPYNVDINGEFVGSTNTNTFESNSLASGSNYSVLVIDDNGCSSNTEVGSETCSCLTEAGNIQMSPVSTCVGETIMINPPEGFTPDPNDVLNYLVEDENGVTISLQSSNIFEYDNDLFTAGVTYTISPIAGNETSPESDTVDIQNDPCISIGAGVTIVWHELPQATIELSENTICPGGGLSVIVTLTNGTLPQYDIIITDDSGAIILTLDNVELSLGEAQEYSIPTALLPTEPTTYTISSMGYNGVTICEQTDVASVEVEIYEPPLITEIVTNDDLEALVPITFTPNISLGSSNQIITYEWTFDNSATILTAPLNNAEETVQYETVGDKEITLTITDGNGCSSTFTQVITIDLLECAASFELSQDTLCVRQEVLITNTSIVSNATPVNWSWTFGSNSTPSTSNQENPPPVSYGLGGTKTITLNITGQGLNCSSFSQDVHVLASPDVQLQQIDEEDILCKNQQIRYLASTNGTSINSYHWTLVQGDSITEISNPLPTINVTWIESGELFVTATNETTMCSDTSIIVVQLEDAEGTAVDIHEKYVSLIERPSISDSVVFVYQERDLCYQWYRAKKEQVEKEGLRSEFALIQDATQQYFVTDRFDEAKDVVWVRVQERLNDGTCAACPNYVFYNNATPSIGMIPFQIPTGETNLSLYLYPNPNNGHFQLELNGNAVGQFNISIFDNMGQLLKQQQFEKESPRNISTAIQVENLSSGIYFLRVVDEKGETYIERFVVQP